MHVTSFTKNNDITQSLHTSKAQTVFVVVISIRYFVITISFYYFIYIYTNKKKPFIYLFFFSYLYFYPNYGKSTNIWLGTGCCTIFSSKWTDFILKFTARVSVKLKLCHHFISCYLTNMMIQPAEWSKLVSWSFRLLQILLHHRLITH